MQFATTIVEIVFSSCLIAQSASERLSASGYCCNEARPLVFEVEDDYQVDTMLWKQCRTGPNTISGARSVQLKFNSTYLRNFLFQISYVSD